MLCFLLSHFLRCPVMDSKIALINVHVVIMALSAETLGKIHIMKN